MNFIDAVLLQSSEWNATNLEYKEVNGKLLEWNLKYLCGRISKMNYGIWKKVDKWKWCIKRQK